MKVFISWSGTRSKAMAVALRDWMKNVIQTLRPYVSARDIAMGARWTEDIARELEESSCGLICLTPANVSEPWINFEAGALSKRLDKSRVVPIGFGVRTSDIEGPLAQFQMAAFDRSEMLEVMKSFNEMIDEPNRLAPAQLTEAFDLWWPKLEEAIRNAEKANEEEVPVRRDSDDILAEILELVRRQHRATFDRSRSRSVGTFLERVRLDRYYDEVTYVVGLDSSDREHDQVVSEIETIVVKWRAHVSEQKELAKRIDLTARTDDGVPRKVEDYWLPIRDQLEQIDGVDFVSQGFGRI